MKCPECKEEMFLLSKEFFTKNGIIIKYYSKCCNIEITTGRPRTASKESEYAEQFGHKLLGKMGE